MLDHETLLLLRLNTLLSIAGKTIIIQLHFPLAKGTMRYLGHNILYTSNLKKNTK